MILLAGLKLADYRCLKNLDLDGFGDVNIIIGPNNRGKSSLLRAIQKLSTTHDTSGPHTLLADDEVKLLQSWEKAWSTLTALSGIQMDADAEERYCGTGNPHLVFRFSPDAVANLINDAVPGGVDALITQWQRTFDPATDVRLLGSTWMLQKRAELRKPWLSEMSLGLGAPPANVFNADKVTLLWFSALRKAIAGRVVACDDGRLQAYKGASIADYAGNQDLAATQWTDTALRLGGLVDSRIEGYRPKSHKLVASSGYDADINAQGSGVRSMICFLIEMVGAGDARVVLIDEPELGLSPAAKHAFLRHIIERLSDKQVFLATHDPTFANPVLWKMASAKTKVSIYVYSHADDTFNKVNSNESTEVAGSFAGYLTHSASTREAHIYVEGRTDAQTFRCLFDSYLWETSIWREVEDRVDIFHLGGEFWSKLVATIPPEPYRSLVILDGDKRKILSPTDGTPGLRRKLEGAFPNKLLFLDGKDLIPDEKTPVDDKVHLLQTALQQGSETVIYTLHRDMLDMYFEDGKQLAKGQNCLKAHRMPFDRMPPEFKVLFEALTRALGAEPRTPHTGN